MPRLNKICRLVTKDVLSVKDRPKFVMSLEGYYSMKMHVLVRFGRWREIVETPLPDSPELYPVTMAMHHYGKAISHAFLGNFDGAEREREAFYARVARIAPERRFFNNSAHAILAVGEKMLEGELAFHKGDFAAAYDALRESVRRDDNLEYIEPWAWMHPPRHALAALLLQQSHYEEAEQVYRDDLGLSARIQRCAQHRDNVWSLARARRMPAGEGRDAGITGCSREACKRARTDRRLDNFVLHVPKAATGAGDCCH